MELKTKLEVKDDFLNSRLTTRLHKEGHIAYTGVFSLIHSEIDWKLFDINLAGKYDGPQNDIAKLDHGAQALSRAAQGSLHIIIHRPSKVTTEPKSRDKISAYGFVEPSLTVSL